MVYEDIFYSIVERLDKLRETYTEHYYDLKDGHVMFVYYSFGKWYYDIRILENIWIDKKEKI